MKCLSFAGRPGSLCADHAHPHPGYCFSSQSDHGEQPPLQPQLQTVSVAPALNASLTGGLNEKKRLLCSVQVGFSEGKHGVAVQNELLTG